MMHLLRIRGFLPYLLVVFFNAFVDLGHKIIIQNTIFKVYDGPTQILLTSIVNALILLPFIMSFTPAGFCSDKYPKNQVMRVSAFVAVALTLFITLCYYLGWFWLAFAMTFMLALQSAFYSPAKYGYIKELSGKENLAGANGMVQAVTIIAILLGLFFFSILFELLLAGKSYTSESTLLVHVAVIGWGLVLLSLVEAALTYIIPKTRERNTRLHFPLRAYLRGKCLRDNLRSIFEREVIWLSIIGLAVFWSISQVMLATFPAHAKETIHITNTVIIQGTMAWAGIGIVIGSIMSSRISGAHIETGLIPVGALGIALCLLLLPTLGSVALHSLNFLAWGIFGGLMIIPLNALIQFHAGKDELGKVLAGNNLLQNVSMFGFLALTVALTLAHTTSYGIFSILLVVSVIGAVYTTYKLPQSLLRLLIAWIIGQRYRLRVLGLNEMPESGGVLLLGNHISWLDWAIVQMASPRPIRFVMLSDIYEQLPLRWLMKLFRNIPIPNRGSAVAMQVIRAALDDGDVVCMFPEGSISRTGQLGEFHRGFEKAAEGAGGVILPFYIRGLWGSWFSRANSKLRQRGNWTLRRDILVAFGAPAAMQASAGEIKQRVFELSIDTWEHYSRDLPSVATAFIRAARRNLYRTVAVDEASGKLSGARLLTAAICFSRLMRRQSNAQNIGLLLPTSCAGVIGNMAALLRGKTVVNLNFTADPKALNHAIQQANIDVVYTSGRFLNRLKKKGVDVLGALRACRVLNLEDLGKKISPFDKALTLIEVQLLPSWLLGLMHGKKIDPESVAAILFSSGSEGMPKGVMLSHRNIMTNLKQTAEVLNVEDQDVIVSSLPLFHAFGMTVTTFMPLIEGIPMVCHPDPTDVVKIAKSIARHRATLLCGTATFLQLYTRNPRVHPLMLESLRIVVSGAEKLPAEVRDAFQLKFGKIVYEGYGATETTPVASVNVPDSLDVQYWQVQTGNKAGTAGLPLPGTSFRIVDPATLRPLPVNKDGLILIGGTQIMRGYLNDPETTRAVIVELEGKRWYKSGDKGHVDKDGFLSIVDRYSRFAKIGGEMISLSAVEAAVRVALQKDDLQLLAINIPDQKKGERISLLITEEYTLAELGKALRASGVPALMIPSAVKVVEQIPILGSGKTDLGAARRLLDHPDDAQEA